MAGLRQKGQLAGGESACARCEHPEACVRDVDEASRVVGRVTVEEGALVKESEIRGPAIIGRGTVVKESFVGPYTSVGRNCQVVGSMLEHCVILDGAKIEGVQRLEDSIIGQNALVLRSLSNHRAIRLMIGDDTAVLL